MKIEVKNTIEEIREIIEKCVNCGMCKSLCPVFKVIFEESYSPRGKAIMLQNNIFNKIIYDCTLCKACELNCPLNIDLYDVFRKARKVLAELGKETNENKKMIENMRKYGNPFGKEIGKKRKLYCC